MRSPLGRARRGPCGAEEDDAAEGPLELRERRESSVLSAAKLAGESPARLSQSPREVEVAPLVDGYELAVAQYDLHGIARAAGCRTGLAGGEGLFVVSATAARGAYPTGGRTPRAITHNHSRLDCTWAACGSVFSIAGGLRALKRGANELHRLSFDTLVTTCPDKVQHRTGTLGGFPPA